MLELGFIFIGFLLGAAFGMAWGILLYKRMLRRELDK